MRIRLKLMELLWQERTLRVDGRTFHASLRLFRELRDVLMDPSSAYDPKRPAYYMFRRVNLPEHEEIFRRRRLRYDVTVIPPAVIGGEYVKTYGHFHPVAEHDPHGRPLSFPELYEVLAGDALFLLQDRAARVFFHVRARAGDVVAMPPNLGHVTVNVGETPLVLANLVSDRFHSDYGPVREKHGFAWYYTVEGWKKNPNYDSHPAPRAGKFYLPLRDIYAVFVERPAFFDFLNRPTKLDWDAWFGVKVY